MAGTISDIAYANGDPRVAVRRHPVVAGSAHHERHGRPRQRREAAAAAVVCRRGRTTITNENGRGYYRLRATMRPGFGESAADDVVLWIDRETARLFCIHMSLNGFETTVGAHIDTTFLEYRDVAGYLLPVRFHERVRGPLRVDAHTWWTTGLDTDRGWRDRM